MTAMDIQTIREELCMALRNGDIISTTIRGVTTKTDTFTATASQTNFTLTQIAVKNVRAVTVQSVSKYYLFDYTINFSTGVVTLLTGATLNDTVTIQYDYSSSADKIYPDFPRHDLKLSSFPRVGIELLNINTKPLGLGGTNYISDVAVSIIAWIPANKDPAFNSYGGTENLSDLMKNIRQTIMTNAKSFYSFKYIHPSSSSPIAQGQNDKLIQQSMDFMIKFILE